MAGFNRKKVDIKSNKKWKNFEREKLFNKKFEKIRLQLGQKMTIRKKIIKPPNKLNNIFTLTSCLELSQWIRSYVHCHRFSKVQNIRSAADYINKFMLKLYPMLFLSSLIG